MLASRIGLRANEEDLRWLRTIVARLDEEGLLHLLTARSMWSIRRVP